MGDDRTDAVNVSTFSTDDGEFVVASFPLKAPDLTNEERELLELVGAELSDEEIARRQEVDAPVIAERVASLCNRLKVDSRAALIEMFRTQM